MNSTLRWVAVVPGAIVGGLLSTFVLHLVLYQTLTGSGIVTPYPHAPELILSPFAVAVAFVWCGSRIAPKHKTETAVVLLGVMLLFVGAGLALGLAHTRIGNTEISVQYFGLPNLAAAIGAFVGLYIVRHQQVSADP